MHGVKREPKLGAIFGNVLVCVEDKFELGCIRLVARVCFAQTVEGQPTQLLQAAGMLFLQGPAALEEAGEVLRAAGQQHGVRRGDGRPTRALAMLAFSRLSSVVTPMSECRTSCTRCCVCESWAGARSSGDEGKGVAVSSIGETGAASSFGPVDALKSGLKLSLLAMGGMEGGAAMVGVVDVRNSRWRRSCQRRAYR